MRITIFILILCNSLFSAAQSRTDRAQVEWGDDFRVLKRMTQKGLILSDNSGHYNLVFEGISSKPVLQKFDNSLRLLQSHEVGLRIEDSPLKFNFLDAIQGNLFAFATRFNAKTDEYFLYCSSINKDTLDKIDDPKMLIGLKYEEDQLDFNSGKFQLNFKG